MKHELYWLIGNFIKKIEGDVKKYSRGWTTVYRPPSTINRPTDQKEN